MRHRPAAHVAVFLVALIGLAAAVAACGSATPTPSPPSSPAPTPTPLPSPIAVESPEAAFARIVELEPRLRGMGPFDREMIGQSAWYQAEPDGDGFTVNVYLGWGDCPAGCIESHRWSYAVAADGTVTLLGEEGPPVPTEVWPSPSGTGLSGVFVTAVAGPICPVENPEDPNCAPRPVAGAVVIVRDARGDEVARATTADDGHAFIELPQGSYVIEAQPVEGLMSAPGAYVFDVPGEGEAQALLGYDTGIR
jgi:hypothetical protein